MGEKLSVNETKAVLNDYGFHLEGMNKKSIEAIIFELTEIMQNMQQGRKWTAYETRVRNQNVHEQKNKEIVETYNDTKINVCHALSVAAQVGGVALTGWFGQAAQGIGQGAGKAIETYSDSVKNQNEASRVGERHIYDTKYNIINDDSKLMKDADDAFERTLSALERIIQNLNRLAESMTSN